MAVKRCKHSFRSNATRFSLLDKWRFSISFFDTSAPRFLVTTEPPASCSQKKTERRTASDQRGPRTEPTARQDGREMEESALKVAHMLTFSDHVGLGQVLCSSSGTGWSQANKLVNPFAALPPELVFHIFSFLCHKDTLRLTEVKPPHTLLLLFEQCVHVALPLTCHHAALQTNKNKNKQTT